MNERRRIVIPTGAEPGEPLQTPHFDAEATLTARPVVPLNEQETSRIHYGDYGGYNTKPFWKRPAMLALIVLFAVGVGVAAGLMIGMYRNRKAAESPVAAAPSATVESTQTRQIAEPTPAPTPQPRPTASPEETKEPADETPAVQKDEERTARNEQKRDEDEVAAPVVREKKKPEKTENDDNEVVADKQAEKERRREERREQRRRQRDDDEAPINIPRNIDRAQKEVNRIREIFEGRQP